MKLIEHLLSTYFTEAVIFDFLCSHTEFFLPRYVSTMCYFLFIIRVLLSFSYWLLFILFRSLILLTKLL